MKFIFSIVLGVLLLLVIQCNEEPTATIPPANPNKTTQEETPQITFEEAVEKHVIEYCNCYKPVQTFVDNHPQAGMDSVQISEYELILAKANLCFNLPEKKAFRDGLSEEEKLKQNELFVKFRTKHCPEIFPVK